MIDQKTAPYAGLLLRVALGVMFVAHGFYLKIFVFTVGGTVGFFESLGLPAVLAYATIAAESIGGLLLIMGVQTRLVSLALIPVLLGATWVHAGNGWLFTAETHEEAGALLKVLLQREAASKAAGGGWEYPLFLTVAAAVQALLGDGAYALKPSSEVKRSASQAA